MFINALIIIKKRNIIVELLLSFKFWLYKKFKYIIGVNLSIIK